jgi:diaminohydroxyphosphoribosylaminopyrimidine deaminase/5-amino-6-(5-phosphoribosylamino)uracil reductase
MPKPTMSEWLCHELHFEPASQVILKNAGLPVDSPFIRAVGVDGTPVDLGTVRDDDPRLTAREVDTPRQPLRVLVDSRLQVDPHARLLQGGALVVCAVRDAAREGELQDRGCEVLHLPGPGDKVDLPALMRALAGRGINELHVEAGFRLNGSLVREGCVDELLVYLAPCLLGDAAGMVDLAALPGLEARRRLVFGDIDRVGDDLRVLARLVAPD